MERLFDKVNSLYDEIIKIEDNARTSLARAGYLVGERLTQEQIDYYPLYEDLKSILAPMLDEYKTLLRTSIGNKAKKVFFVAICEMVKQDFSRGMLITFRYVTNKEINTNRYYDLLSIVSKDQGLDIPIVNERRQFEEAYILETGIPRNLSKYVIKIFNIYWRYFRTFQKDDRLTIIHDFLRGNDFSDIYILNPQDYSALEIYRGYLKQFPEKAIRVFDRLDDIFQALDEFSQASLSDDDKFAFSEIISKQVGYDIKCVLRDSELESIYYSYLNKTPIRKFIEIINNLPKNERIQFPQGEWRVVSNISEQSLLYGIYKVRNIQYEVVVDPTIELVEMAHAECDKIIKLASDYYMFVSEYEFDVEMDGKIIYPRQLYYKGIYRFIWIGKLRPASTAIIAGNTIISEQNSKIYGRVIKCFDYEKKQSRLQYFISSVKMVYPDKKYGRLEYSIDDGSKELIAIGSPQGLYYRESLRVEVDSIVADHEMTFAINGEVVEKLAFSIDSFYLFDKWEGTLYSDCKTNENHSGDLILFSTEAINLDSFKYIISSRYRWGEFQVFEFSVDTKEELIIINNHQFRFGKAGKPYFFFFSETGENKIVDDIDELSFRICNISGQQGFWFNVENEEERIRTDILDGEYKLSDLLSAQQMRTCGKWVCSLWNRQKKLAESSFTVIPKIQIEQINPCVLEGKEVQINITASDNCFLTSDGEFINRSVIDVGRALFSCDGEMFIPQPIETYIFFDKFNAVKSLTYLPNMWGIRSKEGKNEWSKEEIVSVDLGNNIDTQLAAFSSGSNILYVNGHRIVVDKGITKIEWHRILGELKAKNDLVITDERSTLKKVISCMPKFSFVSAEDNGEIIITIEYKGPVSERLRVRCFVNGVLKHTFNRESLKNNFNIHVIVGKSKELYGKRIAVDIGTDRAAIPITVYDSVIDKPKQICEYTSTNNADDHHFEENDSSAEMEKDIEELASYVDFEMLTKWYYQPTDKERVITDINRLIEFYWGK